ncbi:MAG: BrnT family toxin [Acidobacteriota bacterium]|nr:BrnT family toxin [Acidobacteriota bacterium]
MVRDQLDDCVGFDWDDGNIDKNWHSHRVAWWECEEVFFNSPRPIFEDPTHSRTEERLYVLGQTNSGRWLFVSFTVRNDLIRPISARDMNARERKTYDLHSKKDPQVQ